MGVSNALLDIRQTPDHGGFSMIIGIPAFRIWVCRLNVSFHASTVNGFAGLTMKMVG